jgi:hypothetical protein
MAASSASRGVAARISSLVAAATAAIEPARGREARMGEEGRGVCGGSVWDCEAGPLAYLVPPVAWPLLGHKGLGRQLNYSPNASRRNWALERARSALAALPCPSLSLCPKRAD